MANHRRRHCYDNAVIESFVVLRSSPTPRSVTSEESGKVACGDGLQSVEVTGSSPVWPTITFARRVVRSGG